MPLIYCSVGWMIGIYLASRSPFPLLFWALTSLLPLSVAWLWRKNSRVRLLALCGLFLTLGAMRYLLALPHLDSRHVSAYNDRGWVTLVGVVSAEPDVRDAYANLRLRVETLTLEGQEPLDVEGTVLVRAPRYPENLYGDRIAVHGQLETPPTFDTFSYKDYLARQGIYSLMRWARLDLLERGKGNPLLALLLQLKRHMQDVIARVLPEPGASLLTGILLGVESGIPTDLAAAFSLTGTSHIIAISGFNIAIIAGFVSALGVRVVGRRHVAWFSTAVVALYTVFVGAGASVVRAALMGCVAIWGQHLGRQNSTPNALFATAWWMTAWNPHALWDLGFLLSFAATLGLVLWADPFQRGLDRFLTWLLPGAWSEPTSRLLNESLVLTACAQLTTLPIILYNFRTLSLVTLFSNLLILPAQPQVMLWGALAAAGGLIWLPLGRVLGWVAWLFLAYTVWAVEALARLPYAAFSLAWVSPTWVWGWYVVLAGGVWFMGQPEEKRRSLWRALTGRLSTKVLIGGAALLALLAWMAVFTLPDQKLHVTFFDVGEGDAVLIETPDGKQILVNGGPSPARILAQLGKRLPFWDRSLDLVILSDPEEEHLAGLIPVIRRYEVGHLLTTAQPCESALCAGWQDAILEKGVAIQQAVAGTRIDLGHSVFLTVLHPTSAPLAGARSDDHNHSLVLRLDYGQTCFLLAGGIEQDAEAAILARGENLRCDVLQVARHGSQQATSEAFLRAVRPALAIISCGESPGGDGPAPEILDRLIRHGATVVRTDRLGSIELISDGVQYRVRVGR